MHPRQPAAEFPLLSCCALTAAAKAPCSPSPPPLLPLSLHCCGRHCVLRPTEQLSVDATAAPALNPLHPTAPCLPAPLSTRSRILSAQQPHRAGVTDRSPGKGPLFSAPASAAANVAAAVTAAALLRPPLQPDPAAHPPTPSWPTTDPPPLQLSATLPLPTRCAWCSHCCCCCLAADLPCGPRGYPDSAGLEPEPHPPPLEQPTATSATSACATASAASALASACSRATFTPARRPPPPPPLATAPQPT
jgi:hypothetical protein